MAAKPNLNEADLKLLEKRFPTYKELDKRLSRLESRFFSGVDEKFDVQEEKFERKLFEFKNQFFEKIDPILEEVMASREERSIIAHHISELRDRIEKIEKHLGLTS